MKVQIDNDREGWYLAKHFPGPPADDQPIVKVATGLLTYGAAKREAARLGHEVSCGGWKHKLLSWNWYSHCFDHYPEWEMEGQAPAFVKLTHKRGKGDVESSKLCNAWDDIAEVDFYQRDWTSDGIPFVHEDDTYWSGWWFATLAERDRFVAWYESQK